MKAHIQGVKKSTIKPTQAMGIGATICPENLETMASGVSHHAHRPNKMV